MNTNTATRHATGKSREWGSKARKAEAKTYRSGARRKAIAEGKNEGATR